MSDIEFHYGRLLDHVHICVSDLEASKRFYQAILRSLGRGLSGEGEGYFWADELFVSDDAMPTTRLHVAFQAPDRAAYILDPDGNNLEAVHHGPAERSAPSVTIRPIQP